MTRSRSSSRRPSAFLVVGVLVGVAVAAGAFAVLDPIVASAVAIAVLTAVGVGAAARNWDAHETFEDREHARARRRQEKWERGADARARDRVRWEAAKARQARRSGSTASGADGAGR
ncbi:hypothetical protein [Blastococcus saxobsidens]|uniref:Uncharacterized protein n=1 Tax=Blastococcus saxobsidens (strain DD2) TaxID=1146883 RepID=H6RUU3_BLASD|nr:hypothetical protein [Blastococcus saxobsidens]CCG04465.1 conserved exported protein of unknown function [Blastococcus saxobsidens DD2]